MTSCARPLALPFAFALAAFLAAVVLPQGAFAQALRSYVLENVQTKSMDKSADVFIPRIEVVGSNVTRADIEQLLTPDLPAAARADLVMNMQAQRIFVPQVIVTRTGKDAGRFVLRDYLITNLDRARFDRITIGGIDGTMSTENKGEGRLTSGAIVLEGGDFSRVAAAAKAGSAADGVAKLRLFTWAGFEMAMPDADLPATAAGGNMYRIGLKSVRATTDYAGDVPTKAVANFNGLYFYAPPGSSVGRTLASFGYDRVEFGLNFDGAFNPATKIFTLTDYSITGVNAGSLSLSGGFADIDASTFTSNNADRLAALMKGRISGVNLRYVDSGLFEKALAYYAASQGKNVSAVRKEWSMMIMGMLPILAGGDPAALKLAEALGAFVNQPKSLAISLKGKNGPVGMADLMRFTDPMFFLRQVEITAVANR